MPPLRDNLSNHSHEILIKKPCPNHQTNAPYTPPLVATHRSDLPILPTYVYIGGKVSVKVEFKIFYR